MLNMKVYVDTDDDVRLARRWVAASGSSVSGGGGSNSSSRGGSSTAAAAASSRLAQCPAARLPPAVRCSIQRDVAVRGRDVGAVIEQYTKFVKPAFDQYVAPSRKFADIIIPWHRCDAA